eukprot:jgi/Botrbrau1/20386/Bobra.0006s0047.1
MTEIPRPQGRDCSMGAWEDFLEGWVEIEHPLLGGEQTPSHDCGPPQGPPGAPITLSRIKELLEEWKGIDQGVQPSAAGLEVESLVRSLPNPDMFQAGSPGRAHENWVQYFALLGHGPDTGKVLSIMREGYRIEWVHTRSRVQQAHPRHQANLSRVRDQLAQVVGSNRVQALLEGSSPGAVVFPNRKSALVNPGFVGEALAQMCRTGAIRVVDPAQVVVISPLGVVGETSQKPRLILDAMYVNTFVKYVPFHYESLRNLPLLANPEDVMMITDFKSGYHHIPLHPSVHKYFGIQYGGVTYCFTVLPFGLASACRVFTLVMREVWRPLRGLGMRGILYIDDIMSLFQEGAKALVGRALVLSVLAYLHWYLSIHKCDLALPKEGQMLGMVCNLPGGFFKVPALKAVALIQQIEMFQATGGSKRELARLAGKLCSIAPAVQLTPLFTRRLFQALAQAPTWETAVQAEQLELASEDLLYFKEALRVNAGWGWVPRASLHEFYCASDASETGFGGHSLLLPADLVMPFDQDDHLRMQQGHLSSTLREVKNACYLVTACIRHSSHVLKGSTLVAYCDNQGAVANINNMRGSPEEVNAIRDMMILATALDVQIRVEWKPRTAQEIKRADALSRVVDPSDYSLCYKQAAQLMQKWGTPTGDAFAGPWAHSHKAPKFFTATPCHVGLGWDAMIRDWAVLGKLIWVFPPVWLIREALLKVKAQRCNCILLLPSLNPMLRELLRAVPVADTHVILPHAGMFELGSTLPPAMKEPPFTSRLDCFLVRYS